MAKSKLRLDQLEVTTFHLTPPAQKAIIYTGQDQIDTDIRTDPFTEPLDPLTGTLHPTPNTGCFYCPVEPISLDICAL